MLQFVIKELSIFSWGNILFGLTAKPMFNAAFPSIMSTVGIDTPISQLVLQCIDQTMAQ